jgi:phosphonoacetate hydrolase
MDSSDFLTCPTILEKKTACGFKTILITVKDKLRRLLARNVTASYSVEKPSSCIVRKKGQPPPIYSLESSPWLLSAAEHELCDHHWDMVYISTTDYIPHMFAPGKPEARDYMSRLDEGLSRLFELDIVLGIAADHGMNEKKVNVDLEKQLDEAGIKSRFVAAIKDEHKIHHKNLGGSAYLYVKGDIDHAADILYSMEGVESVYDKYTASSKFRLPLDRIGDLLVLADVNHTFGPNRRSVYSDIDIRSHGSLHEREVPFILSSKVEVGHELYNKDLIPLLLHG